MEPKDDKIIPAVNEDAELDKSLEESINAVKAGKELAPEKVEAKPEEVTKEETPVEPKKEEDTSEPQKPAEEKKEEVEFRIPKKGPGESDETFEKRIELLDLVKRRKAAKSEETRQQLSEQIKVVKKDLGHLSGTDKFINPLNEKVEVKPKEEEDPILKADKERLRQLGGVTKEEIEQVLQKERLSFEVKNTLDKFIERHSELKDDETRGVFFDFVDQNYNWANKSGKELITVLELARESMFKPSETIQERVLKAAGVQEKVNAMQFPGGTVAKKSYSPETRKSLDELIATGMSEEKALELISE